MAGNQNLVRRLSRQIVLSVCQVAVYQGGIDAHFVIAIFQSQHLIVRQTESPVLLVVRGAVRDPIRMFGNREQMRLEFGQRHGRMDRGAVVQHMQVGLPEINNPVPLGIFYICVANVPFFGNGPIKNCGSRWHLSGFQRNPLLDHGQSLPEPVARDAAADRIQLGCEAVQLRANLVRVSLIELFQQAHCTGSKFG